MVDFHELCIDTRNSLFPYEITELEPVVTSHDVVQQLGNVPFEFVCCCMFWSSVDAWNVNNYCRYIFQLPLTRNVLSLTVLAQAICSLT